MIKIFAIFLAIGFLISIYPAIIQLIISYDNYKHRLTSKRTALLLFIEALIKPSLLLAIFFFILYLVVKL